METLFAEKPSSNTQGVRYRIHLERIRWTNGARVIAVASAQELDHEGGHDGELIKRRRPVVVIGDIPNAAPGQEYIGIGTARHNARFNTEEIELHTCEEQLPVNPHGIELYLSKTTTWVGPVIAKRIVEAYGPDALNVLRDHPRKVAAEIQGVTEARAQEMSDSLRKNSINDTQYIALAESVKWSMTPRQIKQALIVWGDKAQMKIKRNPYILTELRGVGFATADKIAHEIGVKENSRRRHAAAVTHALDSLHASQGHTSIGADMLAAESAKLVGQLREDAIEFVARVGRTAETRPGQVSRPSIHDAERKAFERILAASRNKPTSELRVQAGDMNVGQARAAAGLTGSCAAILTGGPGTGKTYTIARIVRAAQEAHLTVELCAPTGKAAKQMSQALGGYPARTIHSLLEPSYDEDSGQFRFSRRAAFPIEADIVIIDEFSMVDVNLANSLIDAIPSAYRENQEHRTRIIIVGDRHQLPSVGPGALLRDLIAAGVPTYELTEIMRNAGRIVRACHQIKAGQVPTPNLGRVDFELGENWRHVPCDSTEEVREIIEAILLSKMQELGFTPTDAQIVSSLNESGPLSVRALNELGKSVINPSAQDNTLLEVGDRIVRTKNGRADDYQSSQVHVVANGDIGYIRRIDNKGYVVEFQNPTRVVRLSKSEAYIQHAYCLTCHKMQGSESPLVIIPLHRSTIANQVVNREWLYTAFSRAKKLLITVGQIGVLSGAIHRVGNTQRRTWAETQANRAEKQEAKQA